MDVELNSSVLYYLHSDVLFISNSLKHHVKKLTRLVP